MRSSNKHSMLCSIASMYSLDQNHDCRWIFSVSKFDVDILRTRLLDAE